MKSLTESLGELRRLSGLAEKIDPLASMNKEIDESIWDALVDDLEDELDDARSGVVDALVPTAHRKWREASEDDVANDLNLHVARLLLKEGVPVGEGLKVRLKELPKWIRGYGGTDSYEDIIGEFDKTWEGKLNSKIKAVFDKAVQKAAKSVLSLWDDPDEKRDAPKPSMAEAGKIVIFRFKNAPWDFRDGWQVTAK